MASSDPNEMNLEALRTRLIEAARVAAPSDAVPQGFESRVMWRVRAAAAGASSAGDLLGEWTRGFWRAAVSSVGVCALAFALHVSLPAPAVDWSDSMEMLSADLDSASPAGADVVPEL